MAQEVKDTDTKQAIQDLAESIKASSEKTIQTLQGLSQKETGTQKVKAAEEKSEREQAAALESQPNKVPEKIAPATKYGGKIVVCQPGVFAIAKSHETTL